MPTTARLELMEWLEAAVALRQPRTTAAIEPLQLDVLRLPPDDMLDLSEWIMETTFPKNPAPVADAIDGAIRQLGFGG